MLTLTLSMQEWLTWIAPNPLKAFAHGLPVVMVPIVMYSDDTSGNR